MIRVNIKRAYDKVAFNCVYFFKQFGKRSLCICTVSGKILPYQIDFVNAVFYKLFDFFKDFCF